MLTANIYNTSTQNLPPKKKKLWICLPPPLPSTLVIYRVCAAQPFTPDCSTGHQPAGQACPALQGSACTEHINNLSNSSGSSSLGNYLFTAFCQSQPKPASQSSAKLVGDRLNLTTELNQDRSFSLSYPTVSW